MTRNNALALPRLVWYGTTVFLWKPPYLRCSNRRSKSSCNAIAFILSNSKFRFLSKPQRTRQNTCPDSRFSNGFCTILEGQSGFKTVRIFLITLELTKIPMLVCWKCLVVDELIFILFFPRESGWNERRRWRKEYEIIPHRPSICKISPLRFSACGKTSWYTKNPTCQILQDLARHNKQTCSSGLRRA